MEEFPFNNMNNRDNSFVNRLISFITIVMALMVLFGMSYRAKVSTQEDLADTVNQETVYKADSFYTKLSDDSEDTGKYKIDIVSYDTDTFAIRKIIADDTRSTAKYRFITRLNSNDYKVLIVDENVVHTYILENSSKSPYIIAEFSKNDIENPRSIDLYLPSSYRIDISKFSDTIDENYVQLNKN